MGSRACNRSYNEPMVKQERACETLLKQSSEVCDPVSQRHVSWFLFYFDYFKMAAGVPRPGVVSFGRKKGNMQCWRGVGGIA